MQIIPLSPVPSQHLQVILDNQDCEITLVTRGERMYLDLTCNGVIIQQGAIVEYMTSIVQIQTLDFTGTLSMIDIIGENPPEYTGLNIRYFLTYWSEGEEYAPVNPYPEKVVNV